MEWELEYDQPGVGFLRWLQEQHDRWETTNFPDSVGNAFHGLAGMTEELGELAHSILKMEQNIRGSSEYHKGKAADAFGDICIYMCGVASSLDIDLQSAVELAWMEVGKRNWVENKVDGVVDR